MEIIRITENDAARVLAIYQDCALWLKAKGIHQWHHYLLTDEAMPLVKRRFREGEVYLANFDGQDAGVLVLQWEDSFWGDRGKDPHARFLHSLAVGRNFAGRNLGIELITWAMQEASGRGKTTFRLDTLKGNSRLLQYYRDLGFQDAGTLMWREEELQLFEKAL